MSLTPDQVSELLAEFNLLQVEHSDLDIAIDALDAQATADQLRVQRLKKRKLALKDRIKTIENLLTPNLIA